MKAIAAAGVAAAAATSAWVARPSQPKTNKQAAVAVRTRPFLAPNVTLGNNNNAATAKESRQRQQQRDSNTATATPTAVAAIALSRRLSAKYQ